MTGGRHNAGIVSGLGHPGALTRSGREDRRIHVDPETWLHETPVRQGSGWLAWQHRLPGIRPRGSRRHQWALPIRATLRISNVAIINASRRSPIAICSAIVASSIHGTGAQKWRATCATGWTRSSTTAFGPNSNNRRAASAEDRPAGTGALVTVGCTTESPFPTGRGRCHSPQARNRPISPGKPPGKSSPRADSRKPRLQVALPAQVDFGSLSAQRACPNSAPLH
jgi:hypothetical protein